MVFLPLPCSGNGVVHRKRAYDTPPKDGPGFSFFFRLVCHVPADKNIRKSVNGSSLPSWQGGAEDEIPPLRTYGAIFRNTTLLARRRSGQRMPITRAKSASRDGTSPSLVP